MSRLSAPLRKDDTLEIERSARHACVVTSMISLQFHFLLCTWLRVFWLFGGTAAALTPEERTRLHTTDARAAAPDSASGSGSQDERGTADARRRILRLTHRRAQDDRAVYLRDGTPIAAASAISSRPAR